MLPEKIGTSSLTVSSKRHLPTRRLECQHPQAIAPVVGDSYAGGVAYLSVSNESAEHDGRPEVGLANLSGFQT